MNTDTEPASPPPGLDVRERWAFVTPASGAPVPAPASAAVDTTLVVTTYNRPAHVRRLLAYLCERGLDAKLLLVDASEAATQEENRETLASFFPDASCVGLPSSTSLVDTFKIALHSVETELVAYCPDDDFLDPRFIAEGARFLRENPDYVLCSGRFCLASREEGTTVFSIQSNGSIEQDDPLDRFVHLVENYWPTLRSVQRTAVAIDAATTLDAYAHHSVLGEALHGSAYALYGKVKVLDRVSQVQVEHRSRNQTVDPSPRRLFCHESFWLCLRVLHACVEARLRGAARGDRDERRARVRRAVFRHLANNYWLWRNAILADLPRAMPDLDEARASELYRWLAREVESSLVPELAATRGLPGAGSYERVFKSQHIVRLLLVDDGGRTHRQAHLEMERLGEAEWTRLRGRWLEVRAAAADRARPAIDDVARALLAPDFLERWARFRDARLGGITRILGDDLAEERAATLCDALGVVALLEGIGRLGSHELDLARDLVLRLESDADDAYESLARIADFIARDPDPA